MGNEDLILWIEEQIGICEAKAAEQKMREMYASAMRLEAMAYAYENVLAKLKEQ